MVAGYQVGCWCAVLVRSNNRTHKRLLPDAQWVGFNQGLSTVVKGLILVSSQLLVGCESTYVRV